MAITSLEDYRKAVKQNLLLDKTNRAGTNSTRWFTLWDGTGTPGAATLSPGNTANGLVPDDTSTGAPSIIAYNGTLYLTRAEVWAGQTSTGVGTNRIIIYDRLFHAGAYAFNANTALTSQPSYGSRLPNTDYHGTQIWIEAVTDFTGNPSFAVTYTDQDGHAGHTTGTIAGPTSMRQSEMCQLPLAAGDYGVQKIESVVGSVASAGTFNVVVVRPLLWLPTAQLKQYHRDFTLEQLGMPQITSSACLTGMLFSGAAATFRLQLWLEVASA